MSVNVTIGESKPQEEKPFPKLMIHKDGTITRFRKSSMGVHVWAAKRIIDRGCIMWSELSDINMSEYTDFNEPLTLQNK
jgi:hypothetical protein